MGKFSILGDPSRDRLAATAAVTLATAALALAAPGPPPSLGGELRIVGSRSMQQPVAVWLEIFRDRHPGVRAHTALYGSGLAASGLADSSIDVAPMARRLASGERALIPDGRIPAAIHVGGRRTDGASASPVYLYIALGADGRAEPEAIEFARIAVSAEGQSRVPDGDFQALSGEQREDARSHIAQLQPMARTTETMEER